MTSLNIRRLAITLASAALLLAACGSDDGDAETGSTAAPDTAEVQEEVEEEVAETTSEPDDTAEDEPEAEAESRVIGFSYGLDDAPIYQNVLAPALAEAERLNFTIVEGAAASNCEAQLADIDNMIASQVDAVVVLSLCPGGYDSQVAAAQSAGIAFVTYLWDHPDADGRILLADEIPGELLADAAIDWYDNEYVGAPEDFSWIMHGCSFAPPNIQLRATIPTERITEHTGIAPLETDCALAPPPALDATTQFLQVDPGVNMALGLVDGASLGSYEAFLQADGFDTSNVFVAGVDGELPAVELIANGGGVDGMYALTAALDLEAVGFAVVRVSQAAIDGDAAGSTFQTRHLPISTSDTAGASEWFDRVFGAYIE